MYADPRMRFHTRGTVFAGTGPFVDGGLVYGPSPDDVPGSVFVREYDGSEPAYEPPVHLRARRGRTVFGHVMQWCSPTRINGKNGPYLESFARGSIKMPDGVVPFYLRHKAVGGHHVGVVRRLINGPAWLDVAATVFDTAAGDDILDILGADGSRIPLSIAFDLPNAMSIKYEHGVIPEIQRTRVTLTEVAMVDEAQYPGCYCFAVGHFSSLAPLAAK